GRFPYGALATPRSVDFNSDGLTDLVYSVNGLLTMLPNIGTKEQPRFDATAPIASIPWGNGQLGFNQLVDYNADGWPDLFAGLSWINLNSGRGAPGLFEQTIPLSGAEKIRHPSPRGDHWDYRTLADVDGDSDFDILLGDHPGYVWFHRNDGTIDQPRINVEGEKLMLKDGKPLQVGLPPSDVAPFDVLQGARTAVASGDFNRDGKTDVVACDTYGYLRVFEQAPGERPTFELAVQIEKLEPTRVTAQRVDWNGDGWDDLIASYANDRIYVLVNRAVAGKTAFEAAKLLDVPRCYGDPWPFVGDWNHDGDADLIIDQYGYTRFVERSFIEHGYRPARIIRSEERPTVGAKQ
ncbi:MAG: VCBS repeat-containing protein, partial [Pirellulales bacterium]